MKRTLKIIAGLLMFFVCFIAMIGLCLDARERDIAADDEAGELTTIDVNSVYEGYNIEMRGLRPTHNCPVHGDINIVWTIGDEGYEVCEKCFFSYLIKVLKENIPQITELIKEKQND